MKESERKKFSKKRTKKNVERVVMLHFYSMFSKQNEILYNIVSVVHKGREKERE